jgi:hypothetical protein
MSVGTNIKYANQGRLFDRLMTYLGARNLRHAGKLCCKAGVPANNTADDNPNALGDICLDETTLDVYICTAYTANASATTWTKIVD